jgi:hypothetical protein
MAWKAWPILLCIVLTGLQVAEGSSGMGETNPWTLIEFFQKYELPPVAASGGSVLPLLSNSVRSQRDSDGFQFDLSCKRSQYAKEVDPIKCVQTNALLRRVKSRLDSIFELNSAVKAKVIYVNCPHSSLCSESTLGAAAPLQFVAAKIPELSQTSVRVPVQWTSNAFVLNYEGVYLVPIALAKQMKLTYEVPGQPPITLLQNDPTDMIIIINSNIEFWFGDEDESYNQKYDLEAVIAHEVLVSSLKFLDFQESFRGTIQ